jgi:membrane fusion protein (multidrug efflux system)
MHKRSRVAETWIDVTLKLADGTVYSKSGKVNFSDVRVSGQTGTSEARAELPNPTGLLHPGQFVRVSVRLYDEPDAIVIPSTAVQTGPDGQYVYVVGQDMIADVRKIQVQRTDGDRTVVASGLAKGEQVVTRGQLRLGPKTRIQISKSAAGTS